MELGNIEVNRKKDGQKIAETLTVRWIENDELDQVYDLMIRVHGDMENKELFSLEPKEETFKMFHQSGMILGLFNPEGEIISERYIVKLNKENNSLAADINISEEERDNVIYLKSTIVRNDYVGNKIQYKTLLMVKYLFMNLGYRRFMSTVSPFNGFSLKNALDSGFKVRGLKKKYPTKENPDGLWRCINYMDLDVEEVMEGQEVKVKREDIEKQLELLDNGYVGLRLAEDTDFIIYDKIKERKIKKELTAL